MQPLDCGYQQYAWGKHGNKSVVASMVGKSSDEEGRYAELWIGTHPSKPAKVLGTETTLVDFIANDTSVLGTGDYQERYGANVPYLLKVLSVDKALSVQAHPEREHAKVLHARDPAHYPDANHKPELVVALTQYRALCCFRPVAQIAAHLEAIAALRALVPNADEIVALGNKPENSEEVKRVLRRGLEALYAVPPADVEAALQKHLSALPEEPKTDTDQVFVMLNKQYPGDVGCWMVYFLNLVHLAPGDALFLGPNEPHSYLSGDSVEIMACSDNVVRAGLTPKFKDVPTLIDMLTYRTDALNEAHTTNNNKPVQRYAPPAWCDEFMLTAVRLENGAQETVELPSIAVGIVTKGKGTVNGVPVEFGKTFFIPSNGSKSPSVSVEAVEGELQLFLASTNASN